MCKIFALFCFAKLEGFGKINAPKGSAFAAAPGGGTIYHVSGIAGQDTMDECAGGDSQRIGIWCGRGDFRCNHRAMAETAGLFSYAIFRRIGAGNGKIIGKSIDGLKIFQKMLDRLGVP